MNIAFNDIVPIYIQIADAIEDDILSGRICEGDKCYSQIELARELGINPATAAKGIRLLVDRGVLEKVRGQAMTIKIGAVGSIRKRKESETLGALVGDLVDEAKKLLIKKEELLVMVEQEYER